jgi:hypothetical protein
VARAATTIMVAVVVVVGGDDKINFSFISINKPSVKVDD